MCMSAASTTQFSYATKVCSGVVLADPVMMGLARPAKSNLLTTANATQHRGKVMEPAQEAHIS
jgi:hypothetical protein